MEDFTQTETQIEETLKAACKKMTDRKYSDTEWTNAIKLRLAELGKSQKYLILNPALF